jgi:hypothetical protein
MTYLYILYINNNQMPYLTQYKASNEMPTLR